MKEITMISPFVKKLIKETGIDEKKAVETWNEAKEKVSQKHNKKEEDFEEKKYLAVYNNAKKILGISEENIKPSDFLNSDLDANTFIEQVVSGDFDIGDIKKSDKKKDKKKKRKYVVHTYKKRAEGEKDISNHDTDEYIDVKEIDKAIGEIEEEKE